MNMLNMQKQLQYK